MLLLLVKEIFPEFDPERDDILELADKLCNSLISDNSGIMRYPYDDFSNLSRVGADQIFQLENASKFEAFVEEFNSINQELRFVSARLKDVYANNLNSITTSSLDEITPMDIYYLIEKYRIKAERLLFVSRPDYSLSTGFSKKSKKKYETVKAFWLNANGNKVRSFSKNVGIVGVDLEESVVKLFDSLGYITTQLAYPLDNGYKADLIVEKNGSKWVVEVKIKDKKRIFDTFARLELWKLYQSIYWE
jgi:hypothetical protein